MPIRRKAFALFFLVLCSLVFLTSCPDPSANITPDFSVRLSSSNLNLETIGQKASVTLNIIRLNEFKNELEFSIESGNLPQGISIKQVSTDKDSADFRISYDSKVTAKRYTVGFQVSAAGVTRSGTLTIRVLGDTAATPDFSISLDSSEVSLDSVGQNATVTVNVKRHNNFTESLDFSVERGKLPTGISISQTSNSTDSNSFTFSYDSQTLTGSYEVDFYVSAAGVIRSAKLTIKVKGIEAPADFSVSLDKSSLSFNRIGQNDTVTLKINGNQANDTPTFNIERGNLPNGVVISQTSSDNNSASFKLSYASQVATGNYQITFSATVAGIRRSDSLTLKIASATSGGSSFDISLEFSGSVLEAQKPLFRQAAAKWQRVITGDIPNMDNVSITANQCGVPHPAVNGSIDDVHIFVDVRPIDGVGGVLAMAGPCLTRSNSLFPIYGIMIFDSADARGPLLPTTILHEMGHVLGIGGMWSRKSLVNYSGRNCPTRPLFTAEHTVAEWKRLGQSGAVPVEADGGRGTACSHWDEGALDHELMTGYIERPGKANPLSRVTIASLKDYGYEVNMNAAEAYSVPSCSPNCTSSLEALETQTLDSQLESQLESQRLHGLNIAAHEIILSPIGVVEDDGTIRLLEPAPRQVIPNNLSPENLAPKQNQDSTMHR